MINDLRISNNNHSKCRVLLAKIFTITVAALLIASLFGSKLNSIIVLSHQGILPKTFDFN